MTYKLKFLPSALNEWRKLDPHIQGQFKAQLQKRLETPHVPASRLRGYTNYYKKNYDRLAIVLCMRSRMMRSRFM